MSKKVVFTGDLNKLKDWIEDLAWDHHAIGIRFENKSYEIGEGVANSKHNFDRADERDFPDYGSNEYESLMEFPGTSAYTINSNDLESLQKRFDESEGYSDHCYIVVGDKSCWVDECEGYVLDDDEIVIEDAVVALILK